MLDPGTNATYITEVLYRQVGTEGYTKQMEVMEDPLLMQQQEQQTLVVVAVVDLKKKMEVHLQEVVMVVQELLL